MSEQPNPASNSTPVVEIDSGDEAEYPSHTSNSPRLRRENVIELLSDASDTDDDDEVQIIAENNTPADPDDIQITGETQNHFPGFGIVFPGGPEPRVVSRNSPSRPRQRPRDDSFSRNVRRRPNPVQSRNFYRAAFLRGTPDLPVISHPDIPAMLAEHQHQLLHYFHSHEGEVSSAIMERIRREEERSLDRKMESGK
ncbi:hypothetical protein JCM33374_g29 [Metschnikowia sp. JCM 33374]|nr:hypothetical protein JCM33374_g29 [Metschnikowia sp. JCM 33374]